MTMLELLAAPLGVALLLVGIHTYFGLHILRRGVIFVDLALAQIAALGGLVAFLVGLPPDNPGSEAFSLVFALAGAALLAAMRPRAQGRVPQEALIGLTYAFASALALLVMAEAPEGAEHLRESLTGTLLWAEGGDILKAAAVYAGVALVHVFYGRTILMVSEDAEGAARSGVNVSLVDFIFYATFAVTVTHSVRIAGVLLVFVFLVAPATLAMTWSRASGAGAFRRQLVIGWVVGLVVCVAGMAVSVAGDLTAGPTIIAVYALVLAGSGLVRWLSGVAAPQRMKRLGAVLAVTGALFAILWGVRVLFVDHHDHEAHGGAFVDPPVPSPEHHADHGSEHAPAAAPSDDHEVLVARLSAALLAADLPEEKVAVCTGPGVLGPVVAAALASATDPFDRLALARCLAASDPARARAALTALAADASLPAMVRDEARAHANP